MIISLCTDCVVTDANGWEEELIGRPIPTPTPLSLLTPNSLIEMVDSNEHFSWNRCDGCGSRYGGARFDYILKETKCIRN